MYTSKRLEPLHYYHDPFGGSRMRRLENEEARASKTIIIIIIIIIKRLEPSQQPAKDHNIDEAQSSTL